MEVVKNVYEDILNERVRQNKKWGEQNHSPQYWLGILGEEFGELCQAVNETVLPNADKKHLGGYDEMRKEAVQIAAVAVAFIECLDRANVVKTCDTCKWDSSFETRCIKCKPYDSWEPKPTTIDMVCKQCNHNAVNSVACSACKSYNKFEKKEIKCDSVCDLCRHVDSAINVCNDCEGHSRFESRL